MEKGQVWTIGSTIRWTTGYFQEKGIESPRLDAEVLLAHVLNVTRTQLYMNLDKPLLPAELAAYRDVIRKRVQRIPVAYITGVKEFMGLAFAVNTHVLIPRPETEILVEAALTDLASRPRHGLTVVDVGTGSGAIAVSLAKKLPGIRVLAIDISADALIVARANAERHGVTGAIVFLQGDLLAPLQDREVTAIVANPPYIPRGDLENLPPEVRYEPVTALDGGEQGLSVYRRLMPAVAISLAPGGFCAFEVGNGQAERVGEMLAAQPDLYVKAMINDYAGIPRVVTGGRRE